MAAPGVARVFDGSRDPRPAEDRLAELARAAGPLRRVVAALAGQMADAKGWERLGYARLADYARERLGVSGRALQELARVGRLLDGLPRLEAALVSGQLAWSKVRLLARFATPEDEEGWIAHARSVRVRVLERSLRAVDRGSIEAGALATDEEGADLEPCERFSVRGSPALAFKWQRAKEYASRVSGERIPSGALLEMVTAETLSALPLEGVELGVPAPDSGGVSWSEAADVCADTAAQHTPTRPTAANLCAHPSSEGPCAQPAAAGLCADSPAPEIPSSLHSLEGPAPPDPAGPGRSPVPPAGLPAFLLPLVDGLPDADAFELDARLRRAIRLEQRLDAEIAPLLRLVRLPSLETVARDRLGMSPRKARALLRLERVGEACPALREAWRDGRLSWVQAQVLAPLLVAGGTGAADSNWRSAWVAFAETLTVRALEERVAEALLLRDTDPAAWQRWRDQPDRFGDDIRRRGRQTCARTAGADGTPHAGPTAHPDWMGGIRLQMTAPRDVARLFRAVLCTVRRRIERETGRLATEAEALEAMLDHALTSWGADDPWLRRRIRTHYRIFDRDGWRCTFPGCSSRRNLHAHHIQFRSAGGDDEDDNQTSLCAFHHLRGVHAGHVRVAGRAPTGLTYELGLRPGLPPLARYRSGDRAA